MKNILLPFLALGLLASGCASPSLVRLYSVETAAATEAPAAARRVALLPPGGRFALQQHVRPMQAGLEAFARHAEPADALVAGEAVESALAAQPQLLQEYQKLLDDLVDFDRNLFREKTDKAFVVDDASWSGAQGVKYDCVRTICAESRYQWTAHGPVPASEQWKQSPAAKIPANLRLDWRMIQKPADGRTLDAGAAQALAAALGCDELLVPVVRDTCFFVKQWHIMIFIPIFRSSDVVPHQELALYLVEGKTGRILRSIQTLEPNNGSTYTGGALGAAASLDWMLDQALAVGAFQLKPVP